MSSRSNERGRLERQQLTGPPPPHVSLMPLGGTVRPATNKTSVGFNEPEAATSLPASQDKDSYVESDTTPSEYTTGPNKGYCDPLATATQEYRRHSGPRRRSPTGKNPVGVEQSGATTSLPVSQGQDSYFGSDTKSSKTSQYTPRPEQGYPDPLAPSNQEHQKAYRDSRRRSSSSSSTELGIKADTRSSKGRAPQSERPGQNRYPERSDPPTGTSSLPSPRRDGPSESQGRRRHSSTHRSERKWRGRSPKRSRSQERQNSSNSLTGHRAMFTYATIATGATLYAARKDKGLLGELSRAMSNAITSVVSGDRHRHASRPPSPPPRQLRQRSRSTSRVRDQHDDTRKRSHSRSRSQSRGYDEELVRVTSKDVKYLTAAEITELEHRPSSHVPRQERGRASTPGPSRHRH